MIYDMNPGAGNSNPEEFTLVNNHIFFSAYDTTEAQRLWISDGTASGTKMLSVDFTYPHKITHLNGTAVFSAYSPTTGAEIFKSDGTESGTCLIRDIAPGETGSIINVAAGSRRFCVLGKDFFFPANDGVSGLELWRSDGSAENTVMVKNVVQSCDPQNIINAGEKIFFSCEGCCYGDLWRSDGSETGTLVISELVKDMKWEYTLRDFIDVDGMLYLIAQGVYIYKSDGTEEGTKLVCKWNPSTHVPQYMYYLTSAGDKIFMSAYFSYKAGRELCKADDAGGGIILVRDICPGYNSSEPQNLTEFNNKLYFSAYSPESGRELWVSDGTETGTKMLKDINPYTAGSNPSLLTVSSGFLYFVANDGEHGNELWVSDGTESGTLLTKDINPGSASSNPAQLTDCGGDLYFAAYAPVFGREMWAVKRDRSCNSFFMY